MLAPVIGDTANLKLTARNEQKNDQNETTMLRFIHRHFLIILTITLSACEETTSKVNVAQAMSNSIDTTTFVQTVGDTTDFNNATYFVVVADTNSDYFFLRDKMFKLSMRLQLPIDTMGRFFNKTKNLIALPDNDEDEIYAGDYFPRRFPSDNFSLEYLDFYQREAGEKTIFFNFL